jgi:hypothetical protein
MGPLLAVVQVPLVWKHLPAVLSSGLAITASMRGQSVGTARGLLASTLASM